MTQHYKEPAYLELSQKEKQSITKTLLFFPALCFCFLLVMIVGELNVTSSLPSFTKCKYFFTANRIVNDFCRGETDSVMAHNLAYFDNGTLNHVYYSGIQDIYDGGTELLSDVYETFLQDELVISFVGMPQAKGQTHLNKFCNEDDRPYVWYAIGYIFKGKQDIIQVDIRFVSPDIYYIFLSPSVSELSEDATEDDQKAFLEYKESPEFALLQQTGDYLNWVYNVASSHSEDTVKYIENVFNRDSVSAPLINQFVTCYFTNEGNYLNQIFTEEIKKNYQQNFAWMLCALAQEVNIIESNISYGMYDKTTKSISMSLSFEMKDNLGNIAFVRIPVLYTPAGYQVISEHISYVAGAEFQSQRILQLITFLRSDIMPEDILLERAAYELKKK